MIKPIPDAEFLADGVYIGLSDKRYFKQDRLGSTDLKKLHEEPESWWYGSNHNPAKVDDDPTAKPHYAFGKGLHWLVLEGEAAYERNVVVRPDTYPDAKTGEAKKWTMSAGFCKEWVKQRVKPDQALLDANDDRAIRHMAELILHHPELGAPMRGGLSEVAIFWTTADGVRLRAKIDKFLPRFTCDMKHYGDDAQGRTVKEHCLRLVAKRDMDIQRYLYTTARLRMPELIAAGALFGGTEPEREWITKAAEIDNPQWCWIFYRKRDDESATAPLIKPIIRRHLDITFDTGRRKTDVAISNYQAFVRRFGFDVPWAIIEATEEPEDHEFPPWLDTVREPVTFPAEETNP